MRKPPSRHVIVVSVAILFFVFFPRLFQVPSEEDAMNWFPQYALKLRPFYEMIPSLKPETIQPIVDCLRSHPDWSSAHIAVDKGLRDCLKHNYILR